MYLKSIRRIALFLGFLLAFVTSMFAQSFESRDISNLFDIKPTIFRGDESLEAGVMLELNEQILTRIHRDADFNVRMDLPISYEETITLEMTKTSVLADGFILRSSSGDTLDYEAPVFYRGEIVGHEGFCAITVYNDHLAGLIAIKGKGDYNLGKIENQRNTDYVIFNDLHLKGEHTFECHTPDSPIQHGSHTVEELLEERYSTCVKVFVVGDYALFQDKGGVAEAADYIVAVYAEVAALYDAESIGIEISEILVLESPDGYPTDGTDPNNNNPLIALQQFKQNYPDFNGDLAHLFALGGYLMGGIAYTGVLCNENLNYAYMNIDSNFENYPTYSWTVEVVAHEMGHNFGSPHTHACAWGPNGDEQIDDCGSYYQVNVGLEPLQPGPNPPWTEDDGYSCYDENDLQIPNFGTVMSYCHLWWDIPGTNGIDLALGFGDEPGDLIRSNYNSAGCLTACTGGIEDPPIAEFESDVTEICVGDYVQFYDLSGNNPDEWLWYFEGGLPDQSTEQEPWVQYTVAGLFDVELLVTNSGGSDNMYLDDYIFVVEGPSSFFDFTLSDYSEVSFENMSENADGYYWDFGDGNISFEENPTHVYENDGTYTVTLFAEHNFCEEDMFSKTVQIVSPPEAGIIIPVDTGCDSLVVNFTDNSSPNVTDWAWTFEGGTPATSTQQNPTINFQAPGIYTVSLEVSNSLYSDVVEYTDTITILSSPTAAFDASVNGSTVTFTNNSMDENEVLWNFGDGNTSTEENPVYSYTESGTFTCELIVTNECGSDTTTMDIQISAMANAAFMVLKDTICVFDTAYFNSLSNTDNIQWIFESGSPSMSEIRDPKVVYDNPGTFMVTQYAYNQLGGDTLEIDNYITVLDNPSGSFSSTIDGYEASFSQLVTNATDFMWDFGDGSTTDVENPTHSYDEDGSYTVSLTIYGICDTVVFEENIEIANPPVAAFTFDVTGGCAPLTVQFTNQSSSNSDSFEWTFEGGTPAESNEQNPVVIFEDAGIFSVVLQSINEQGQDLMIMDDAIEVLGTPEIDFSYDSDLLTVSFSYTGDPDEFESWDFGDGNTSTMMNPTHTYAAEGYYEVTLYASNDCGTNELTQTVEATIKPEASFAFDNNAGCAPVTVNYTNETTGNPSSLVWLFEGGTPSSSIEENPTVEYYEGGTFSTQLIAFSANGNDTLTMNDIITVDAGPDPNFYFTMDGATVTFVNQTEDANSYIWNFGDGVASVEENPVHTFTANGTYTVTMYAKNDCGQKSKKVTIEITTVNTFEAYIQHFKLYPNPNDGRFELEMELAEQQVISIRIFDLIGKQIDQRKENLSSGFQKIYLDYSGLESGFYILEVGNDKASKRMKFAVQ